MLSTIPPVQIQLTNGFTIAWIAVISPPDSQPASVKYTSRFQVEPIATSVFGFFFVVVVEAGAQA